MRNKTVGVVCVAMAVAAATFAWPLNPQLDGSSQSQPTAPLPPWSRIVTGRDQVRVEELETQIAELRKKGCYAESIPLAEEAATIRTRVQGVDHWAAADAKRLVQTLRYIAVLPAAAQSELAEADRDDTNRDELFRQHKYRDALGIARRQIDVRTRWLGETHPDIAVAVYCAAWSAWWGGETLDCAESFFRKSLEIQRKLHAASHPALAEALHDLAFFLSRDGNRREAEPFFREAVAVRRELLGLNSEDLSLSLFQLAELLRTDGVSGEAEPMYREALEICRRSPGAERGVIANASSLAALLTAKGEYSEAEELYRETLTILRRAPQPDSPTVAKSLYLFACMLTDKGDYARAEALHRAALAMKLDMSGDRDGDVANSQLMLGQLLTRRGDPVEAEAHLRAALTTWRAIYGDKKLCVASCLAALARTLSDQGKYREAEQAFRGALEISRRLGAGDDSRAAPILCNLAATLLAEGNDVAARQTCEEVLAICEKEGATSSPARFACLNLLAGLQDAAGDHAGAAAQCREALTLARALYGDVHPETVQLQRNLARVQYDGGDYTVAEATWLEAARLFEVARLRVGTSGLERVGFSYAYSPLWLLAGCLARDGKPQLAWEYLEADLARGLLDTLSTQAIRPLDPSERQNEETYLQQLGELDRELGMLLATNTADKHSVKIGELRKQREQALAEFATFEQELTLHHGVAAGKVYALTKIQARLPMNAALLTWVDMKARPNAADPNGEHWACVVRCQGEPHWVRLPGSGAGGTWAHDDDELPAQLRRALSTASSIDEELRLLLAAGHRQRIAPAKQYLGGINGLPPVEHLIVLPAEWMAGIPVEALTDQFVVRYAPSGTIYAWLSERRRSRDVPRALDAPGELLALGDPTFSPPPGEASPSERVPSGDGKAAFVSLPGTRGEVRAIAQLFEKAARQPRATLLLGSQASEQKIQELSRADGLRRFRFLHLATHAVMNDEMPMSSALILAQDQLKEQIERAIAGEEAYDGRLTAEQIIRTWKLDADLVTLSGCYTALGRAAGGEGCLGFSQALFVAGARSLLLSLWKVDDTATALLMTRFYEDLLGVEHDGNESQNPEHKSGDVTKQSTPMSKVEALREAKFWLRRLSAEQVRSLCTATGLTIPGELARGEPGPMKSPEAAEHPFEHPYYWSAFILIGGTD